MKVQINCVAGDWTFYSTSYFADMRFCVDDVEILGGAVGGIVVSIEKLNLLAPYLGLASTVIVATVATSIYTKRVKRRKERQ
jgi:hypothetical protein